MKAPSPAAEQLINDLAHFAWCALVALHTARQDGKARSPLATHTFLLGWLASAQKQRRFPRTVAQEINDYLQAGRQKGASARLQQRLEHLWQSCSDPAGRASELFRLIQTIEQLRTDGWICAAVADKEWIPEKLADKYAGKSALLLRKSDLVCHFSEQGKILAPVDLLVTGEIAAVTKKMDASQLSFTVRVSDGTGFLLSLTV